MKFNNLKTLMKLVESFELNKYCTFLESLEQAQKIQQIIKDEGYEIDDGYKDVELDFSSDDQILKVNKQDMRIRKVLLALIPEIAAMPDSKEKTEKLNNLLIKIQQLNPFSSIKINVENDIINFYTGDSGEVRSCMTGKSGLVKFYEDLGTENVQVVIIRDANNKVLGRALLWHNVKDKDGNTYTYLDRQYPPDNPEIEGRFKNWAKEKGYLYRNDLKAGSFTSTSKGNIELYFQIPKELFMQGITMPFMDTFYYGNLLNGMISNTDFENNSVAFGSTKGTIFDAFITWKGGIWKGQTWSNGIWEGGIWENGEWNDGLWRGGEWQDGKWRKGQWEGGIWQDGEWIDGDWYGGTWNNGIWRNGSWHRGKWFNGDFRGGAFGIDTSKVSEWHDGEWLGGLWFSGIWKGGKWINGTIYDANKKGKAFDENGKLKDGWELFGMGGRYVKSKISPKEYFDGTK